LATLLGVAIRTPCAHRFTLILALHLDPAGVLLLVAATRRDENEEPRGRICDPVAPLMWKSGTRHVSMARATYLARPIATSR